MLLFESVGKFYLHYLRICNAEIPLTFYYAGDKNQREMKNRSSGGAWLDNRLKQRVEQVRVTTTELLTFF